MNCVKVGRSILQLRREKGLTQQQMADLLHISNKTVSKWECGLGCPDVSLWSNLSAVLGVDMQKLLEGKLELNRPDVGKIDQLRFYVCAGCGNILTSTGESSISCCGRRLHPLSPASDCPAHEVTLETLDTDHYVTFRHEMTKEHYISFAASVCCDRILLVRLYPEQSAEVRMPLLRGRGDLYLYCTRHGLQKYADFF